MVEMLALVRSSMVVVADGVAVKDNVPCGCRSDLTDGESATVSTGVGITASSLDGGLLIAVASVGTC